MRTMQNSRFYLIGIFAGFVLFVAPHYASAATVRFISIPSAAGDGATVVEARIDPQAAKINVVEGVIALQGTLASNVTVRPETGGSLLTLWPTSPQYSAQDHAVRFTGGLPDGFTREGLLFRLRLSAVKTGTVTLSWAGGSAYLNDGKGTVEPISARSITVNLDGHTKDAIAPSSPDSAPPQFGALEIGKDANTFDGKYFVSINATDDVSGIARYEVNERGVTTTVTNGVYILQNQDRSSPVTVTAYDNAGNSASTTLPAESGWGKTGILVLVIVLILGIALRYGYPKVIRR